MADFSLYSPLMAELMDTVEPTKALTPDEVVVGSTCRMSIPLYGTSGNDLAGGRLRQTQRHSFRAMAPTAYCFRYRTPSDGRPMSTAWTGQHPPSSPGVQDIPTGECRKLTLMGSASYVDFAIRSQHHSPPTAVSPLASCRYRNDILYARFRQRHLVVNAGDVRTRTMIRTFAPAAPIPATVVPFRLCLHRVYRPVHAAAIARTASLDTVLTHSYLARRMDNRYIRQHRRSAVLRDVNFGRCSLQHPAPAPHKACFPDDPSQ